MWRAFSPGPRKRQRSADPDLFAALASDAILDGAHSGTGMVAAFLHQRHNGRKDGVYRPTCQIANNQLQAPNPFPEVWTESLVVRLGLGTAR